VEVVSGYDSCVSSTVSSRLEQRYIRRWYGRGAKI